MTPEDQIIALYPKLVAGAKWLGEKSRSEHDWLRFRQLEAQLDRLWASLNDDSRARVWAVLCQKKAFAGQIEAARAEFGGKVFKLNA